LNLKTENKILNIINLISLKRKQMMKSVALTKPAMNAQKQPFSLRNGKF